MLDQKRTNGDGLVVGLGVARHAENSVNGLLETNIAIGTFLALDKEKLELVEASCVADAHAVSVSIPSEVGGVVLSEHGLSGYLGAADRVKSIAVT